MPDPLRIGIDVAQLSDHALTGIPLYIEGLLRELLPSAVSNGERFTLVGSPRGADLPALLAARGIAVSTDTGIVPAVDPRFGERFAAFRRLPGMASFARKWDGRVAIPAGVTLTTRKLTPPLDLFHHTSILRVGPRAARRHIVTIYDLTARFFPETHNRVNIFEWERVFAFARDRADRVITDSESARRDIIEHLGVPPDRVRAIPLGLRPLPPVTPDDARRVVESHDLGGRRFVLAVGSLEPRKNLPRLIDAFARITREPGNDDVCLALTGARLHGAEAVEAAVARHGLGARIRRTGYVSDADLAALLGSCAVFAYPSLYEGFGLPVLEAMAAGAPVVTSNLSSLPEVAGEAALLVDPTDTDAIADGVRRLLADTALAAEYGRCGRARAALFTNARTAEAHRRLYHEVAGA